MNMLRRRFERCVRLNAVVAGARGQVLLESCSSKHSKRRTSDYAGAHSGYAMNCG